MPSVYHCMRGKLNIKHLNALRENNKLSFIMDPNIKKLIWNINENIPQTFHTSLWKPGSSKVMGESLHSSRISPLKH